MFKKILFAAAILFALSYLMLGYEPDTSNETNLELSEKKLGGEKFLDPPLTAGKIVVTKKTSKIDNNDMTPVLQEPTLAVKEMLHDYEFYMENLIKRGMLKTAYELMLTKAIAIENDLERIEVYKQIGSLYPETYEDLKFLEIYYQLSNVYEEFNKKEISQKIKNHPDSYYSIIPSCFAGLENKTELAKPESERRLISQIRSCLNESREIYPLPKKAKTFLSVVMGVYSSRHGVDEFKKLYESLKTQNYPDLGEFEKRFPDQLIKTLK